LLEPLTPVTSSVNHGDPGSGSSPPDTEVGAAGLGCDRIRAMAALVVFLPLTLVAALVEGMVMAGVEEHGDGCD
jgi:hypothetical protein